MRVLNWRRITPYCQKRAPRSAPFCRARSGQHPGPDGKTGYPECRATERHQFTCARFRRYPCRSNPSQRSGLACTACPCRVERRQWRRRDTRLRDRRRSRMPGRACRGTGSLRCGLAYHQYCRRTRCRSGGRQNPRSGSAANGMGSRNRGYASLGAP